MKALCSWDFKLGDFLEASVLLFHRFRQCDPVGKRKAAEPNSIHFTPPLAALSKAYFFRVLMPSVASLIELIVKADLNSVGVTCP